MVEIAVVKLPHIANFDDFDPLMTEPGVRVRYVQSVAELGRPHAVVVPGTKSTMADLGWLRRQLEEVRPLLQPETLVVLSSQVAAGFAAELERDWRQAEPRSETGFRPPLQTRAQEKCSFQQRRRTKERM